MFGDYDAFIVHPVEKGQALLFEFRSADAVHIQIIAELGINIDQSLILSTLLPKGRIYLPSTENASSTLPGMPPVEA